MNGRILVVDDDEAIRSTFLFYLSRSGFSVRCCESAVAAFGTISEFKPNVILTDVHMPEMSGMELLQRLHQADPDIDVIVMTGYEGMETAVESMRDGAFEYLVKPIDLDQLDVVLKRCFGGQAARRKLASEALLTSPIETTALVGSSRNMIEIYKTVGAIASTRAPVIIRGETGTGKEMIARAIHEHSPSAAEPFIAINCTAVPEALLESELFGHLKGSFTGAVSDRRGRFELAGSGTIFLDEIGDTSGAFQAKLLRVLQEREYYPVGAERPKHTSARVIAATHRNIEQLIEEGKFREDLYFRLKVVEINIPPLRERPDDIHKLANYMIAKASRELNKEQRVITPAVLEALRAHNWPGNVRELENAITRAVVLSTGPIISPEHLGIEPRATHGEVPEEKLDLLEDGKLADAERNQVQRILSATGWNKRRAAQILGISRPRLDRLIEKFDITHPPQN